MRVQLVHLMTADTVPDGHQPSNQATDLASEPAARLLPSTSAIAFYYHYTAKKPILILPSHGGGTMSRPRTAQGCILQWMS